MSIPETRSKIKALVIPLFKIGCFVLILSISFILGRISALSGNRPKTPLKIIYPPFVTTSIPLYKTSAASNEPDLWAFAGSKTGETYYPKDCPGLTRIKPENRVYFITAQEASDAGYHVSTACK